MFPELSSVFKTTLLIITTLILYLFAKFIVVPLSKIQSYKRQGYVTYFFPLLGAMKRSFEYESKYNDGADYFRQLARSKPDAPCEFTNFGSGVSLTLYDPKMIKDFYQKQSYYTKVSMTNGMQVILGNGLVLSEGEVWKSHRKVISSVFHFEFLKQSVPLIVNTVQELLNELAQGSKQSMGINSEIEKITGEIVGRIFFGENLKQYDIKGQSLTICLARLLQQTTLVVRDPATMFLFFTGLNLKWSPAYRNFLDEAADFRAKCNQIVEDRKAANIETKDLLGALLETGKDSKSVGTFTDADIIDEFTTFFAAGMDTTAHLVTMTLYLLYKNPQYIAQLESEINKIYNQTKPVTLEALNQMELMHAVLKEALRLYVSLPTLIPRIALEDHELMGVKVKKGMGVRTAPIYNFANEKYFEEPEKFMPERWLKKKENDSDPYVFIPFSSGARNCIGQHLAIIEAKIILSEFLTKFSFKIVPEDFVLKMSHLFLYKLKNPILMDLELKS